MTTFDNHLSPTDIVHLFSLFFLLSLLFLTNKKKEKKSCYNNCLNWLFKYRYSSFFIRQNN